jgi:hypothetical protein
MAMADVRMPLESYPLQALVSEPVKPVFPCDSSQIASSVWVVMWRPPCWL